MPSKRITRRMPASSQKSPTELDRVGQALARIKIIGGLLVARGVGMRQAELGDQFTYLGSQVMDEAEAGIAALKGATRAKRT